MIKGGKSSEILMMMTVMRALALLLLASTANAQAPGDLCTTDADCTVGGDPKCVVESEYYAACVDCASDVFSTQCHTMSADFLKAAEVTCALSCDGRCPTGANSECSNSTAGATCVKSSSEDACVDCTNQEVFIQECFYQPPDFVIAAEAKCGLIWTGRCPHHTNLECPSGETCVVQDGGYFDECIDCSPAAYQNTCIYLSDEMRADADAACGLTCVVNATVSKHATVVKKSVAAEVIKKALSGTADRRL